MKRLLLKGEGRMKVVCRYVNENMAELILNRPKQKNAVDMEVVHQLLEHLKRLSENENLTILMIRGEGGAFCSGGDLQAFHELRSKDDALTMLKPMCQVLKKIVALPAVTVSFIDGPAVGGGAEIAASTDFRIATKRSKVGFIQGRLHLTTGWGGTSILKRRVGEVVALQMTGTAHIYTAEEVKDIGFINKIVPSISEAYLWAERWITAPAVIRNYKSILSIDKEKLYTEMNREVDICSSLWESEEHHEAVECFLRKEKK